MESKVFHIWELTYGICCQVKLNIVATFLFSNIELENGSLKNLLARFVKRIY